MSRVGKLPVAIPKDVKVDVAEREIAIKGGKGELKMGISGDVQITVDDGKIWVKPANDSKRARAMWGTMRNSINNMVQGVSQGFTLRLEINGVGFRASADKNFLTLALGYSHEIKYAIPAGVSIICEKPTLIVISGFDRQHVGQVAGELRRLRKLDPYKGKGVKYEGQKIVMKEGKKK